MEAGSLTDAGASRSDDRLTGPIAMSANEALRRLSEGVATKRSQPGAAGGRFSWHPNGMRFVIKVRRLLPGPYAMRAVGEVEDEGAGGRIDVRFKQDPVGVALRWVEVVLALLLIGGSVIAATRQPVFLAFAVVVAIGTAALLWSQRAREEEVAALRELIVGATDPGQPTKARDDADK